MSLPNSPVASTTRLQKSKVVPQRIDLALQGGGAHGAFTWGVLDRLLQDETLEIAGVSGTSAGAMNAVALAAGLMEGGREGAREALGRFWHRVAAASPFHTIETGLFAHFVGERNPLWSAWAAPWNQAAKWWSQQASPYQFNPLNLNPLRRILNETVNFDRVRCCNKMQLFVSATVVRTGELRIFRSHEVSVDVVLASACLPLLFQAVTIDGEAYWDGGYAGNPSLLPLITESPADDLLLVQINPSLRDEVPTRADTILDRINEITFNASLLKEMRSIDLLQQLIVDEGLLAVPSQNPLFQRIGALKIHRIDGGQNLAALGASSKTRTDWAFLSMLFNRGVEASDRWLAENRQHIGSRSTLRFSPSAGENHSKGCPP